MKIITIILGAALVAGACFGETGAEVRAAWVKFADRLARPVLAPMSEGRLSEVYNYENGTLEVSPTWDGRNKRVAYMEMFARLMTGFAPWFAAPDVDAPAGTPLAEEEKIRRELRAMALKAYAHAVDPASPDYLGWKAGGQTLVDAAFLVESFLRGWDGLWMPLDETTKQRYREEIAALHRYTPPYNNWLLFCSLEEAFLMKARGNVDAYRLRSGLYKAEEWYVGDGWYSDGPSFAFDYYNSYVIQPMYLEAMETIVGCGQSGLFHYVDQSGRGKSAKDKLPEILNRMRKYSVILERMVSPEGTYPVFGRSIPYRMAVFQPLALLAWKKQLPKELPEGQVRAALEAVRKNMFSDDRNFNKAGFLTLGFNGAYPGASDRYTNNGSLYMTSLFLMPLGLPATDSFWTAPEEDWTSRKAWTGQPFPKDHKWNINPQPLY